MIDRLNRENKRVENLSFRIWFHDGSTVPETWGGQNIITSVKQLRELAHQYNFSANEVLDWGESEMHDEFDVIIGGVVTNER